ncbi:MAG: signal peptidase II [Oscillospiraceae bacterium]|jgi:signal peptidase II|nr:signal peptidase II [Oscillospiraceae bacterium]
MTGLWQGLSVLAIVGLDRYIKYWATQHLAGQAVQPLVPGVVHMIYVENRGAAFGILANRRWLFLILTVAAVCVILWALLRRWPQTPLGSWSLCLILGGALGNFFDRVVSGYVVDMFEFLFVRFAIFNVADIFVTTGGALFCLYLLFRHDRPAGGKDETDAAAAL